MYYGDGNVVLRHGQTTGTCKMVANMTTTQILVSVEAVYNADTDKIEFLSFEDSSGRRIVVGDGGDGGEVNFKLNKAIFGFYGGTKDGLLVALGFHVLQDFSEFRVQSAVVGGRLGFNSQWDDKSSYAGANSPFCPPPSCLVRPAFRRTKTWMQMKCECRSTDE